jgi:very-short-patch-repair endonuclease
MANERSRALRRNSTDAERRVWSALRNRRLQGFRFRRQYPIGALITDFAYPAQARCRAYPADFRNKAIAAALFHG